jgi:carboxypeptidase D
VGTGFTLGTPNIENETQLAEQFYGFLTHLYSVFPELATKVGFSLCDRPHAFSHYRQKLFIAGESYAGMLTPAHRMPDADQTQGSTSRTSRRGS